MEKTSKGYSIIMPTLYVVATPIGNLSDLSPRAKEILSTVELIAAEDTSHTVKLLNYFDIKTHMISYHKFNEAERTPYIIGKMLEDGIDVAIVTDAGTPCISDPGYDLIAAARQSNINVIGVPGPCAAVTALSISGFQVDRFAFYGFLDRDNNRRTAQLEEIKNSPIENYVIYESPFRIIDTLKDIAEHIPSRVCICNDITKLHEYSFSADVNDAIAAMESNEKTEKGEYVIIVNKYPQQKEDEVNGEQPSTEALLVDYMVKHDCTAKDAIAFLKSSTKLSKKELYNASLNLKTLFADEGEDD